MRRAPGWLRPLPLLAAAAAASLLAACASYQAQERRLTIAPDPVPCADGTPGACLRVTDAEGDAWITHLDEIEGFTYEPGFTYELLVEAASEVEQIESATPPRLRLIRVLSRQESGAPRQALRDDLGRPRWVLSTLAPSGHAPADWAASGITAQFDIWGGAPVRLRRLQQLFGGTEGCGRSDAGVGARCDPQGLPGRYGHGTGAGVSRPDRRGQGLRGDGGSSRAVARRRRRHGVSRRRALRGRRLAGQHPRRASPIVRCAGYG